MVMTDLVDLPRLPGLLWLQKVLVRQFYYRAGVETRAKGMKLYHHTRLTDRNTRNRQDVLFGDYQNIISNGPNGYLFLD